MCTSPGGERMTKLVRYVCRASGHQQLSLFDAQAPWSPNPLTLREGAWAYCPIGAQEAHDWEQIADRLIDDLREETERTISAAQSGGSA